MQNYCTWSALTKGFLILVLLLIAFELMYGSIETKNLQDDVPFNTVRLPFHTMNKSNASSKSAKATTNSVIKPLLKYTNESLTINGTSASYNGTTPASPAELKPNQTESPPPSAVAGTTTARPSCPEDPPPSAGRIPVTTGKVPTIRELEEELAWLEPGGHWVPESCEPQKAVAIIVPFRCRAEHLLVFLKHMHPFLRRQMLDYTIFIVEQNDGGPFNRAMLMNVGFKEALKRRAYDCFIFHDIDLLPEDDRNMYTCPTQPRHMSVAVSTMKYKLPYSRIFGGVSAITREHFELLNGFSNSFWGWGGEDDDMSNRIAYHKLTISRYPFTVARYTMLTHKKDKANPNRYSTLKNGKTKYNTDGLNSLRYSVDEYKQKLLYTWVLATLHKE